MYTDAEYLSALERMKADFEERSGGSTKLTFTETNDIRLHAKSLTDLDSDDLTADQAAWKVLYDTLTEELRRIDPELMAQIEPLEARLDALKAVQGAITAKLEAHPHDYGFRVPLVFLIVGGLIATFRDGGLWSITVFAVASCSIGFLVSIFFLNSVQVQSIVAIKLDRVGLTRMAHWLYERSIPSAEIGH